MLRALCRRGEPTIGAESTAAEEGFNSRVAVIVEVIFQKIDEYPTSCRISVEEVLLVGIMRFAVGGQIWMATFGVAQITAKA